MKDFAAYLFVATLLAYLFFLVAATFTTPVWQIERSPRTGVCYEVVLRHAGGGFVRDSHPVDSSFCEEKETR